MSFYLTLLKLNLIWLSLVTYLTYELLGAPPPSYEVCCHALVDQLNLYCHVDQFLSRRIYLQLLKPKPGQLQRVARFCHIC